MPVALAIALVALVLAGTATGAPVNDPLREFQWYLTSVRAEQAWDETFGDPSVVIAILDTGIEPTAPDLAGRLVPGRDVANDDDDPSDGNGHGTAVAGIVGAAADNGIGIAGACPRCSLMPIKVTVDGSDEVQKSDSAEGIVWAVDHGARVINLSIGSSNTSEVQREAVEYAWAHGAVVVAAAGNESAAEPLYPAAYDNVLAVGATTEREQLWRGSNYGDWVDVGAPGFGILTVDSHGGNVRENGTSFAAPIVSGLAGLLFSALPGASNETIVRAIESATVWIPPFAPGRSFRGGRIDFPLALAKARAAGAPTLSVERFALSPEASFVRGYAAARAGLEFATGARVVRDDTGEVVPDGFVTCAASIGARTVPVVTARFRNQAAVCVLRAPRWAGERWLTGTLTVSREGFEVTQPFRVKLRKPLRGA